MPFDIESIELLPRDSVDETDFQPIEQEPPMPPEEEPTPPTPEVEPEVYAETLTESTQVPIEDLIANYYHVIPADPEKQYFLFNPKPNVARHGSHIINQHYLLTRHWRPMNVDAPEGKVVVLRYEVGHPEHPAGYSQFIDSNREIWVRPMTVKNKEDMDRFLKDNPGYAPNADDVTLVHGKNGAMVLDKKRGFRAGDDIGDKLPTKAQVEAMERRVQAARERMPDEFYDSLVDSTEKALGR